MGATDNKPMLILIVINVVALLVIFWLLGMIMGGGNFPGADIMQSQPSGAAVQSSVSMEEDVTNLTKSSDSAAARAATAISKFKKAIEGEVFSDPESEKLLGDAAQNLSASDAAYLAEYKQMKAQGSAPGSTSTPSPEEAKNLSVRESNGKASSVDYLNKVDVSGQGGTGKLSLAQQIQSVVKVDETAASKPDQASSPASTTDSDKTYIASLQTAAAERENETRLIRVNSGDTLWRIAIRAYGSGFEYPRIFKANPHLKSPDQITTGELLRVPL